MQTSFTSARLADPAIREANDILRTCVHCGFCLPSCPTYALWGEEMDSPRGRIHLVKMALDGEVPLVLHLEAPNRHDVAVSSDLARFWREHYPALRTRLSRRAAGRRR